MHLRAGSGRARPSARDREAAGRTGAPPAAARGGRRGAPRGSPRPFRGRSPRGSLRSRFAGGELGPWGGEDVPLRAVDARIPARASLGDPPVAWPRRPSVSETVSVAIVARNAERDLGPCLAHVAAQTAPAAEI